MTQWQVEVQASQQCFSVTTLAAAGLESLPSPAVCVGTRQHVSGAWPRTWKAPASGRFQVALSYANAHGPINTGITAAVKNLTARCDGSEAQKMPLVLPHSVTTQDSTTASFSAHAAATCRFALEPGFNMSYLAHFAHYTGGSGGHDGPLNDADIGDLLITPLSTGTASP